MSAWPQETKRKFAAYAGLAIRSGKVAVGTDNILNRRVKVVLADSVLSPNARKKLDTRCEFLHVPLIEVESLGELIYKPACKALGICEPNLAKTIIKLISDIA